LVTLPGGFGVPRRLADGGVGYPLSSTAGVGVVELRAKAAATVLLTFGAVPPHNGQWNLRVADNQREQPFPLRTAMQVSVKVAVPRGVSQLLVKVDPAPTSEADAIMLTAPRAEHATGAAVLTAQPISPDPGF
jgi:hypothetical protein